jgi:dsRNA-specific ribonuclease
MIGRHHHHHTDEPLIIYNGSRADDFKKLIESIISKGKLLPKYYNWLTNEESLEIFSQVFTSTTADLNKNYEVYEQLGDITVNKFIVWYMYERFPQLRCSKGVKVVARLRINYGSKQSFSSIAESLNFWSFITASEDERSRNKKPLLEDTLEAFFGAVEYVIDSKTLVGVGYAVVNDILTQIFNEIPISLKYEDLYDAKTRLKELFDFFADKLGTLKYIDTKAVEEKLTTSIVYQITPENKQIKLGEGVASLKADAQQRAASYALSVLKDKGFTKPIPEIYNSFH